MRASSQTRSSASKFVLISSSTALSGAASNNKFARLLAERAQFIGEARVPGRLYDFGRYPGAVASDQPDEWILRRNLLLVDPTRSSTALDEYEGPEFERAMRRPHHEATYGLLDLLVCRKRSRAA